MIKEQKCAQCGAMMRFDPKSGKLVCDYCGLTVEIEEEPAAAETENEGSEEESAAEPEKLEGFDFKKLRDKAVNLNADALPIYNCVSCGAEVIAPPEQFALTCPYCKNNIVLTEKTSGNLRPDAVVPFRITPKDLPDAMKAFYKDKVLLPKRFFSEHTMGKITGIYVPFWVFDGKIAGTLQYNATRTSRDRQGDYVINSTNHYMLSRKASMEFANVPVDASVKMDDNTMDSLEPFDIGEAKPFDMAYLAGFTADRFDVAADDIVERAERRMKNSAFSIVGDDASAGYVSCKYSGGNMKADLDARYMLLPVYVFDIEYAGRTFHFAVNGQTGKVIGDVPVGKAESRAYFFKRFGIVAGALIILTVVKYLIGR